MENGQIKAVIFDAEGVVVDTEVLWDKSQEVLLGRRGLKYDRDYLKPRMAGQTLQQGAQLMIDYYGLNEEAGHIAEERLEVIQELFERDIQLINGFHAFCDILDRTTLKRSIATAMRKSLMTKVERKLNLKHYFGEHIYFIEDVNNRSKPEPDVFLLAAEKMNVAPDNCLVIEDAPHGIEAANRAGMTSVGLTTTFTGAQLKEADFIASDFDSIWEWMKDGTFYTPIN